MNVASSHTRGSASPGIVRKAAMLAVLLGLCCWWSITYTRGPGGISTLWVASGVLCGVLLTSPQRQWPLLMFVAFISSVIVNVWWRDGAWDIGLGLSFANIIDASLVAL